MAYEFGGHITQLVLCAFRRGGLSEAGHHQEVHPPLSGGGGGLVTKSCLTLLQPHVPCQAPLPMEFSKQGYWSGLPFPTLGDLLDPGIEPRYPALQADSLPSEPPGKPPVPKTSAERTTGSFTPYRVTSAYFPSLEGLLRQD